MNDIKVPPFTEGQQELIKMTEKLASSRKICDVDDIDDDIKDIKEIILETISKIETQKQTNFDRITASPEALAKVIMRIVTSSEAHGYNGYCLFDDFDFDEFMKDMKDYDEEVGTKTEYEHYKEVLMWLKQGE